jgi:hypothetical protein
LSVNSKVAHVVVGESDIQCIAQSTEEVVGVAGGEKLLRIKVQGVSAGKGLAVGHRAAGRAVAVAPVRARA